MSKAFNPKDIPDQSGRVFFITGGTAGLGKSSIGMLASKSPSQIYFSGRNAKQAESLIAEWQPQYPNVTFTFLACDLSSLASVKECAEQFFKTNPGRLDVLICNAGVMCLEPGQSKDGYEIQFAINHLGHALLTKLLLPLLEKTAEEPDSDVRIVNLTSVAYKTTPKGGIEFAALKTSQPHPSPIYMPAKWMRYGQSKLANLLYARELSKRHPSITSVAVHPGYVRTDLFASTTFVDRIPVFFMSRAAGGWTPVEQGCWNQVWAATAQKGKGGVETGRYFEPVAVEVEPETVEGRSDELSEKLWKWTEEELKNWM